MSEAEDASPDDLVAKLPKGPGVPCLDAMVLFLFHQHVRFRELGELFPAGAYTADVILAEEVGGTEQWRRRNAAILEAPWLRSAPVLTGSDAAMVNNLLNIWNSPPNQDRGEAEIVVLCMRHDWLAITDDARKGRPELERRKREYCYVVTMLIYAAATGHAGMDIASAWEISRDIQQGRNKPYINAEQTFRKLVAVARRVWEQRGRPGWPEMLADWTIDHLVDIADGRKPPRPPRS